jgi:succinyl-diaminopimelate desuccinylase
MREPAYVSRRDPYVRSLCRSAGRFVEGESVSIGRDGASDVISFQRVGIPAVEFGPSGAGHHGPEEWVSITSLARYRRALSDFVRHLPIWLEGGDPVPEDADRPPLRIVGGGGAA